MTKTCTLCDTNRPLSDFYKRTERRYKSECKSCFKARMNQLHDKKKKTLVNMFGGACSECGYSKHYRVLQFHHTNPLTKSFGIAQRLSAPLAVLVAECQKCELLCANCHAERHLSVNS